LFHAAYKLESLITVALLIADAEWVRYSYVVAYGGALCSTDTDTRIGIGRIRIRGYIKFLQKLKAQKCIEVSDTDTRICIGYVIRGHVEVSGLYRRCNRALPCLVEILVCLVKIPVSVLLLESAELLWQVCALLPKVQGKRGSSRKRLGGCEASVHATYIRDESS